MVHYYISAFNVKEHHAEENEKINCLPFCTILPQSVQYFWPTIFNSALHWGQLCTLVDVVGLPAEYAFSESLD